MVSSVTVTRPEDGVALLTLDRPERRNALMAAVFEDLSIALTELDLDEDVRAIVVTGAGDSFCAGHDLDEVEKQDGLAVSPRLRQLERDVVRLVKVRTSATPTIAAINGAARGGGMSLAFACDMRVASTAASLGVGYIDIDLCSGDAGLSWTLTRLVGHGLAAELMLTGRIVNGVEAASMRLVNQVVSPDELLPTAIGMARQIASHSSLAVQLTKRTINAAESLSFEDALLVENLAQAIALDSPEARQRVSAFLARRR